MCILHTFRHRIHMHLIEVFHSLLAPTRDFPPVPGLASLKLTASPGAGGQWTYSHASHKVILYVFFYHHVMSMLSYFEILHPIYDPSRICLVVGCSAKVPWIKPVEAFMFELPAGRGRFPRSRACANQLYLPKYETREEWPTRALLCFEAAPQDIEHKATLNAIWPVALWFGVALSSYHAWNAVC